MKDTSGEMPLNFKKWAKEVNEGRNEKVKIKNNQKHHPREVEKLEERTIEEQRALLVLIQKCLANCRSLRII